jgi:CRISPR system Cascade subunit CasD
MNHTLLLRLAGPMQSWGTNSRFKIRDTGLEPSKSGVLGLICAAMGKARDENKPDQIGFPKLAELTALRMGVRVNREGVMKKDYHTSGGCHRKGENYGVVKASGTPGDTVISERYYLSDADFLVGLEGANDQLLQQINEKLANPHWQLFLGRKSFVPGFPVHIPDGFLRNTGLEHALQKWPLNNGDKQEKLRFVVESVADDSDAEARYDCPVSFVERRFTLRYVTTKFVNFQSIDGGEPCISLD